MRQRRAKTYRKLMSIYSLLFGFRKPYQVLVDSEMCRLAVAAKMDLQQQLGTVLQGTVKPMITQCCIYELYLQGKAQQAAVDLAKSFERRKCNHREAVPGEECVASVIGNLDDPAGDSNQHRYAIATQSRTLRTKLRMIPAVPIVHVNRAVMILEPPSEATLKVKQENEGKAFEPSAAELATIRSDTQIKFPRRRKGPKEPNPLSMKKKVAPRARQPTSTPDNSSNADPSTGQKRKSNEDEFTMRKRKRRRKHAASEAPDYSQT